MMMFVGVYNFFLLKIIHKTAKLFIMMIAPISDHMILPGISRGKLRGGEVEVPFDRLDISLSRAVQQQ